MKSVDLSNYALEDLLSFDDIFLDYFNNFLKNYTFPQKVQYNRYLGLFEEIDSTPYSIVKTDRLPKRVNIKDKTGQQDTGLNLNDTEQYKVFDWVRQERLPLFFRTNLFRQFKLCKLLTRSLDNARSDSIASSQLIGGYSRQSPPISNTLSTIEPDARVLTGVSQSIPYPFEFINEDSNQINEDEINVRLNEFNEEVNAKNLDMLERFNKILFQRPGSRALSVPSYFPFATLNRYMSSNLLKKSANEKENENNTVDAKTYRDDDDSDYNAVVSKRPPTSVTSLTPKYDHNQASNLKRLENVSDLTKLDEIEIKKSHKKIIGYSLKDDPKIREKLNRSKNVKDLLTKFEGIEPEKAELSDEDSIEEEISDKYEITSSSNAKSIGRDLSKSQIIKNKAYYDELNAFSSRSESPSANGKESGSGGPVKNFTPQKKMLADEEDNEEDEEEEEEIEENIGGADENESPFDDMGEFGELHASINQYKVKFLGSVNGMREFFEFLKPTAGDRLVKFWLDCEFYRDSMQDYDQIENMATRIRLFREINEKYVFSFSKKVHEKISENYLGTPSLNHMLFDHIQYDILRRLRSYWVPRFILNKLKNAGKDYGAYPLPPMTPEYSRQSTYLTAPSSSKSIPTSAKNFSQHGFPINDKQRETLYLKVKQALYADKEAGGPFLRYISTNHPNYLPLILFWYDVCDFNQTDKRGYDKNSLLQHAWAIYNSYLSSTARFNIGLSSEVSEEARKSLQLQSYKLNNSTQEIDSSIFQPVMELIVPYLQGAWLEFIKDDVNKYTSARLAPIINSKGAQSDSDDENSMMQFLRSNGVQDGKIPDSEVVIEADNIFVKRPWAQSFLTNRTKAQVKTLKKKVELTEEQRAERAKMLRRMAIERKKALRAEAKRAKLKRLNKIDEEDNTQNKDDKRNKKSATTFQTDRGSFFTKFIASNNKIMIELFRKHLYDVGSKPLLSRFDAYRDAATYLDLNDNMKRNISGTAFMKNYLDPNSKKTILNLPDGLQQVLQADLVTSSSSQTGTMGRPRTPFMKSYIRHDDIRNRFEEEFQKFCELSVMEYSLQMRPEDFSQLTHPEIFEIIGKSFKEIDFYDDDKGDGKKQPTSQHKNEFLRMLYEWSIGNYPEKLYGFYAHLSEYSPKDQLPFLEKDLLFCIDTIRLREINGDEVLKLKTQNISDVYLETQLQPNLQIDVNHEMHQKLLKSAIKITQGSSVPGDFIPFDEARANFCKVLYDYWAAFSDPENKKHIQMTRQERLLRERLDDFLAAKNPSPSDFKLPPIARPQSRITTPNPSNAPVTSTILPPASGSNNTGVPGTASTPKLSQQQQQTSISIVFSISTGIKYKDDRSNPNTAGAATTLSPLLATHDRRNSVQVKSPSLLSANKA